MISTSVFCPYERLLAKALHYFKDVVKMPTANLRLTFEDGFTTPVFNVGTTEVIDINLGRSKEQRVSLLSSPTFKAVLTVEDGNSVSTREITVVNNLKTDQLPFEKDSNGKHNALNASGEQFAYPEPYFTENAEVTLDPEEGVSEPLLIRPIYQYTEPRVSGNQWLIYGPDAILFKYKKYGRLEAYDCTEGKSKRRVYNVLEDHPLVIEDDKKKQKEDKLGLELYYLTDGVVFKKFSLSHAMRGIEGDYIPGEELMKIVRCFVKLEQSNYNPPIAEAMGIYYDEDLHGWVMRVDVTDNRTYVNKEGSAYDSKYLRRNGAVLSITDCIAPLGDGIAFIAQRDNIPRYIQIMNGKVHSTTPLCYAEILTRSILQGKFMISVWLEVLKSLFADGAITLSGDLTALTGAFSEKKKVVLSTSVGNYLLTMSNTKNVTFPLDDGMYIALCSEVANEAPEFGIAFQHRENSDVVLLDPRVKGYEQGADFSTAIAAQKTFDERDFNVVGFTYKLAENGVTLASGSATGVEYV